MKEDQFLNKKEIWRQTRIKEKIKYKKKEDIHLRATELEREFIKEKAKELNMTLSEYMLENSLYSKINIIDYKHLSELSVAISRIGNSINQIARVLNTVNLKEEKISNEQIKLIEKEYDDFVKLKNDLDEICKQQWNNLATVIQKDEILEFKF